MPLSTFLFASSTIVFAGLWASTLLGARALAERHLIAIRFAMEHLPWSSCRPFLRCYIEGRFDVIAQDWPQFADYCRWQDAEP